MGIGKIAALVVVVSLTALPVASCGMIEFQGHELLRNKAPDAEDLTKALGGLGGEGSPGVTPREEGERKNLFTDDDAWLHILYVAVVAVAVVGFLVPAGSRLLAGLGVLGFAGLVVFLVQFDKMLGDAADEAKGLVGIDWEIGAYLALIGFAGFVFAGLRPATGAAAPPAVPAPPPGDDASAS
jgi:hypothetical protein